MNRKIDARLKRLKTLPVFPTLLTAGNLACGLTAILCAASYSPNQSSMLIIGASLVFVAMVFDMFDGKVARMTNTSGPFGAELDSLADAVSFGVAPAILVHRLVLGQPGVFATGEKLLWLVTVFYAVMAAIRLARYNVEHSDEATPWFRGLPSPGAAALVCAWIIFHQYTSNNPNNEVSQWLIRSGLVVPGPWSGLESHDPYRWGLIAVTALAALLMVSTVRYPHVGNTLFGRISFRSMIVLLLVISALLFFPLPYVLFVATTSYVAWGLFRGTWELWRNWRQGRGILVDEDEDAADDLGAGNGNGSPGDPGPAPGR